MDRTTLAAKLRALLWPRRDDDHVQQPQPVAPPPREQAPEPPPSLWANPVEDDTRREGALWSR